LIEEVVVMDVEECVHCIGLAEILPHLVDESLHDDAESGNMDTAERLDKLYWKMYDSRQKILHTIARKIDAHEDLWIPLARFLSLKEGEIDQLFLMEEGGGSPSRYFLDRLRHENPDLTTDDFKNGARYCNLLEIDDIVKNEKGELSMCYMLSSTYSDIEDYLNLPREAPRWKILAEHFTVPIHSSKLRRHIRAPNIYSPATMILTRYLQMCPGEFRKIGEFLARERKIVFPCKGGACDYKTIGEFLLHGQKLLLPPNSTGAKNL
jgi:hypothetical protein